MVRTSRASTGARGRLEVVGERGVNGWEHADVLQSAQMAGTHGFFSRPHAPTCVWQLHGGVNNGKVAFDALGLARSEREMRKGGESGCPERKNGSLPPFIIDSRAGKNTRGIGGLGGVVVKSRPHGD